MTTCRCSARRGLTPDGRCIECGQPDGPRSDAERRVIDSLTRHFGRSLELIAKWDEGAWDEVPTGDVIEELRRFLTMSSIVQDALVLDAILQITWHTGRAVTVRVAGTHVNFDLVEVAGRDFNLDSYQDRMRLIGWAELLRNRTPNAPLPEPPA